jgi:hypothetical protein
MGTRAQSQNCAQVPATVASTARRLPPRNEKQSLARSKLSFWPCDFCRMYVHWTEREHEAAIEAVAADPNVMVVLTQCGLVKFFLCPFMHAQPRLLNALVDYWHPDAEAFMIEGQFLVPTTEDICFLTGLSRRGEPVNLQTFLWGRAKSRS